MKSLDRTRPFAEYFPPIDGAWYEQDGRQFRMDGSPMDEVMPSVKVEPAEVPAEVEAPRRRGRPPKAREGE